MKERKGNIRKQSQIDKLDSTRNELHKKVNETIKDYPEHVREMIHEEFFQIPFVDKYYKPKIDKILKELESNVANKES